MPGFNEKKKKKTGEDKNRKSKENAKLGLSKWDLSLFGKDKIISVFLVF